MDKQFVLGRLMELPGEIEKAEKVVIDAVKKLESAKNELILAETDALLQGKIDDKNEAVRKAQLLELTSVERETISKSEHKLSLARLELNGKLNEFKALRSAARLLSSEVV